MVNKIFIGDSANWLIDEKRIEPLSDRPAGAKLEVSIRLFSGSVVPIASELRDGNLLCSITAEQSTRLTAGKAMLILCARADEYKRTLILSTFDIVSLAEQSFDGLSLARRCYEQAKRALATFTATGGRVKSYTIGSRSTTYNSAQELMDLVNYWASQVAAEEACHSENDPFKKLIEFV